MKMIDIHVMANFRHSHTKAWNKRHPNWVAMMKLTGCGSTLGIMLCGELGVDPDGYEFKNKEAGE